MSKRNKVALIFSLLVCAVLALTFLIPVSAGQQTAQPESFAVIDGQRQNTDVIQVAYEPPPGAVLQATEEPTPADEPTAVAMVEVTSEPGGDVIINLPDNPTPTQPDPTPFNLTYLIYGIILTILGGGGISAILNRFGKNKAALDAGEAIYQDKVNEDLRNHVREAFVSIRDINLRLLDVIDKITDGQPNEVSPEVTQALNSIPRNNPTDPPIYPS